MDWLEHTRQVSIEISTVCSMSYLHLECSLHYRREAVMPTKLVHKILFELGENEYGGAISFSRYGEPMQDPRLWSFITMTKIRVPRASIVITTNGGFLTQSVMYELEALGVDKLHLSLYGSTLSQEKQKRATEELGKYLSTMQLEVPLPVNGHTHKPLINIYTREENKSYAVCCFQPLADISIDVVGNVTLCCLDWKSKHAMGNITNRTLESIISSPSVRTVFKSLSTGERTFPICKRCGSSRR